MDVDRAYKEQWARTRDHETARDVQSTHSLSGLTPEIVALDGKLNAPVAPPDPLAAAHKYSSSRFPLLELAPAHQWPLFGMMLPMSPIPDRCQRHLARDIACLPLMLQRNGQLKHAVIDVRRKIEHRQQSV